MGQPYRTETLAPALAYILVVGVIASIAGAFLRGWAGVAACLIPMILLMALGFMVAIGGIDYGFRGTIYLFILFFVLYVIIYIIGGDSFVDAVFACWADSWNWCFAHPIGSICILSSIPLVGSLALYLVFKI